jgi:hypothetical protein
MFLSDQTAAANAEILAFLSSQQKQPSSKAIEDIERSHGTT